ncbi:MAG: hypothetical protein C5B51_11165 [Terriglobia bacterium]|nr:MAG: hypothetical protein C5B51_11165 [Terriglobia bacterium]
MLALLTSWGGIASTNIGGAAGLAVSVDPSGTYEVYVADLGWRFSGSIGAPLVNVAVASGGDAAGNYSEISFDFVSDAARHAAIRAYGNHQTLLFTVTSPNGSPNSFSFPKWNQFPRNLDRLTYAGIFAPPSFNSSSDESPWIFFDSSANAFILSPAANFMASQTGYSANGELQSGISPKIAALPQGFQHQTLLVVERGINRAFDTWGQTLTALQGKTRPANDADRSLKYVGYWTDNGASYYYKTAPSLSYEDTLAAVKSDFDRMAIGLGYIQLDSWFYPKGASGLWNDGGSGIYQYTASPTLFPGSLSAFQQRVGVSLITHARWIDPSSPYRQLYKMSGNVVTDMAYWRAVAAYLSSSGVGTYEQDWLDDKAHTDFNLTDADTFLNNMASGMAQRGLTMQYCMASPRHFLQGSRYNNLTTIRTSADRFVRARWTEFLYTSRLASALGIWPFTDVLLSRETENLLLATLSAGPVGIGDAIGTESRDNLLRSVRRDGVIVKPDVPVTPIDSSFQNAAHAPDAVQLAAASTDFGELRTYYLFAYGQGSNVQAKFSTSELGLDSPTYVYDYFAGAGRVVNPSETVAAPIGDSSLYLIAAPIGPSGIAVLGDLGQFVSMGKKRIPSLTDNGKVHLTIAFADGEQTRVISGYSPVRPAVKAMSGSTGALIYDPVTKLFQIPVMPGPDGTATIRIRKRTRLTVAPPAGQSPAIEN